MTNYLEKWVKGVTAKSYPWVIGTTCTRDPVKCESNRYDKRCHGRACPFNHRNGK